MADHYRSRHHGGYADYEEELGFFRRLRQQKAVAGARKSAAVLSPRHRQAVAAAVVEREYTSKAVSTLGVPLKDHDYVLLKQISNEKDQIRRRMMELEEQAQRLIIRTRLRNDSFSIGPARHGEEDILPRQSKKCPQGSVLPPTSWIAEESGLYQHGATGKRSSSGISRNDLASWPQKSLSTNNYSCPSKRSCTFHSKSRSPKDKRARSREELEKLAERRPSGIPLASPTDKNLLSSYQATLRQSLEFFLASEQDIESSQKGRKRKIQVGQVGIRCRYCAHLHPALQTNGACTFPRSKESIYMCAQNIAMAHMVVSAGRQQDACSCMPEDIRQALIEKKAKQSASAVGSDYWANKGCVCNLKEENGALWLE